MDSKLVSVIIPVYNTEKYIADCMHSVLNQTYRNLEIILINDGSTDDSAAECERFAADARVKFVNRENKGLSFTRQQGIDMATGAYFCNLDSDDMLHPQFVEKMLQKITEADADIVTCGRKDFDDGFEREYYLTAKEDIYTLTKESVANDFNKLRSELWLADSWNKMYKTEFIRNAGVKYWLNNRYNGTDLSYNHLAVLHCPKIVVVNEPLLLHRIVAGSRVHRKNKPLQEGFMIIVDKVFNEAESLGYGKEFFESYRYCYFTLMEMVFYAIIDESESIKELANRFKAYRALRNEYGKQHPVLAPENLNVKQSNGFKNWVYKCMLSDSLLFCVTVFILNKIRNVKNSKRK